MAEVTDPTVIKSSTKLSLGIRYPSQLIEPGGKEKKIHTFESITVTRNREQRTINTVGAARKGFVTIEGDFIASFTFPELDPALPFVENLYDSNELFDIVIVEKSPGQDEWQLNEVLAIGCLFENVSTTYQFGDKPMREYSVKYLRSDVQDLSGKTHTDRDGIYWEISVTW